MSTGLALGLLASLLWGLVDIAAAISTRRVGSARVLVGTQLVSITVLLSVALLSPELLGENAADGIAAGLPLGLLVCVVYLAYFTALRIGPVSIVSPVVVAYGGMTVVLAVLFRGETLSTAQAAGAVIATVGVVLAAITFDARSLRTARIAGTGVAVAVFTLIGFAVMTVLLAGPIREHGWLPVIVGSRIGNTAGAVAIMAFGLGAGASRLRPLMIPWRGWSKVAVIAVVCSGLFDVTGFIAFSIGLEVAPAWLIGLASSFGPVLVVGWAIVHLGERPRANQWVGLAILAAGVAVLALAG
jgi:drug/metabolite transporter (DMT)-like permease